MKIIINNCFGAKSYSLEMKFIIETFCAESTYRGIKLDRALTFRRHLEALHIKLRTRVGLLKRLAGSTWGAGATAFRTATLGVVDYAAGYCSLI